MGYEMLIILLIAMIGFTFWSTRQQKKQQQKEYSFCKKAVNLEYSEITDTQMCKYTMYI